MKKFGRLNWTILIIFGLTIKVDFNNKTQPCIFNNSKGEKVNIVNPYYDVDYKDEIVYSIETNKCIR